MDDRIPELAQASPFASGRNDSALFHAIEPVDTGAFVLKFDGVDGSENALEEKVAQPGKAGRERLARLLFSNGQVPLGGGVFCSQKSTYPFMGFAQNSSGRIHQSNLIFE